MTAHGRPPAATRSAPWRWAWLGALLGALLTLAAQVPAGWAAPWIARATGGHVLLEQARGTLWRGSALVVLAGGPGSTTRQTLPGRLAWRLALRLPADSASGRRGPAIDLMLTQACCLQGPARLRLSLHGGGTLHVDALDWQGPAGLAQGLGTPWNTLGFQGTLQVTAHALQLRRQAGGLRVDGRLSLTAVALSSRISQLPSLGSYRFDVDGQDAVHGEPLRFTLATLEGPLRLSGHGVWMAGQLRFSGQAQAEDGHRVALAHVLRLIGNRDGPVTLRVLG